MPITLVSTSNQAPLDGEGLVAYDAGLNNWVIASTLTGYRVLNITSDGTTYTTSVVSNYNFGTSYDGISLGGLNTNYDRDLKIIEINGEPLFFDLNDTHLNVFSLDVATGDLELRSSTQINVNAASAGDNYNVSVQPSDDGTSIRLIWEEWDAGDTQTILLSGDGATVLEPKTTLYDGNYVWAGDLVSVDDGAGGSTYFHVGHQWGYDNFYVTEVPTDGSAPSATTPQTVAGGANYPYEMMSVRMPQASGPDRTFLYVSNNGSLATYEIDASGNIVFLANQTVPGVTEYSVSGDLYVDGIGTQYGTFTGGVVVSFNADGTINVEATGTIPDTEADNLVINGTLHVISNQSGRLRIYDTGIIAVDPPPICFVSGTQIVTSRGRINIENLRVGDLVLTMDSGFQPIRWMGSRKLDAIDLRVHAKFRPIRIRAGALGDGLPDQDLLVSPQHRILVRSKIALNMFGREEVLAAAKQLLLIEGIEVAEDVSDVEYWHILFEKHEIVWANGAPSESLYTGNEALKSVSPAAREEIFSIFPELRKPIPENRPEGARLLITGRQARKLSQRHAIKNRSLLELPRRSAYPLPQVERCFDATKAPRLGNA
ncbi:MAG: Hint domain-containing protein [Paracoccaceae bacterium]|nr:Hint domain-containing protein [Paracoccaceae bacterium]